MAGKKITTFLMDGKPEGSRYIYIGNRVCRMYVIPRSDSDKFNKIKELEQPSLYILLGENEDFKPMAYIGQTDSFKSRIRSHIINKDFWQKAIIFIAEGDSLIKTDVLYLEYLSINEANKANRYVLEENKQTPNLPKIKEEDKATMDDFFLDIKFLISFYGCDIFKSATSRISKEHIFMIERKDVHSKGIYDGSGFTVLKGSIISKDSFPSLTSKEKRQKMAYEYAKLINGELVMQSDKTFSSPSAAGVFCVGSNINGWSEWKDQDGRTLDKIYRK
jgi:hypothetical protein